MRCRRDIPHKMDYLDSWVGRVLANRNIIEVALVRQALQWPIIEVALVRQALQSTQWRPHSTQSYLYPIRRLL